MTQLRCDIFEIKAVRNDEGFLTDSPVITRTGVFEYADGKGGIRKEYRPPEVVFAADSLNGYKGIPITSGHPGLVTSANVRKHSVGAVLSAGRQDENNVVTDIIIHDPGIVDAGYKQLSVGYKVEFDETPGVTPDGQRYDAKQIKIMPNHLALVKVGRAGNARLNLDAADAVFNEDVKMEKIRLDSGISYEAAPEVIQELSKFKQDAIDALAKVDAVQAKADAAQAEVDALKAGADKLKQDARDEALARVKLESIAESHKVKFAQDATDRQIREGVIKAIKQDAADMTGKSDAYVESAFDIYVGQHKAQTSVTSEQRKALKEDGVKEVVKTSREIYLENLKNASKGAK